MPYHRCVLFLALFLSFGIMAQDSILFENNDTAQHSIVSGVESRQTATLLKSYLDQAFQNPFKIQETAPSTGPNLHLEIASDFTDHESFVIKSNENDVYLIARDQKNLRYAVYTLLEKWGFRKFTAADTFIPEILMVSYPKNHFESHCPSFEYRALLYPDAFDASFRDWHKLDWHPDDFGIWGHSFEILLPSGANFDANPKLFALYEGTRRRESLCMTNDTVVQLVSRKMSEILSKIPDAQFYSVSQNDDIIYCECEECQKINKQCGGPQGSLYYFLNRLAAQFPKSRIMTLAYLHTLRPAENLEIAPNIYTMLCPIALDRGKSLNQNDSFKNLLESWSSKTKNLFLWDYTVQFSNYMSPFPNLHTFSENFKLYEKNHVKGLFIQGYADVPGDLSELRQYLLAKLAWDASTDIKAATNDFLRGFYGKAAPAIKEYLDLLTAIHLREPQYLDIYSGPVQSRTTFLTPQAMDQYDRLLEKAEALAKTDPKCAQRVLKLRMALEYVYFEQAKFYGKDRHGIFTTTAKGKSYVPKKLTKRVKAFSENCAAMGLYELSEGGISPSQYYREWIAITKNNAAHLGENLPVTFRTSPAAEYAVKGPYSLVDGNRGYKNFILNWVGWYGNDAEFTIETSHLEFTRLKINFLEDQRHWIFLPEKVAVYGSDGSGWELIGEMLFGDMTENSATTIQSREILSSKFRNFTTLKILAVNQKQLPVWRKRKNKAPMLMIDEVEFYK